jgi:hypothetical protein
VHQTTIFVDDFEGVVLLWMDSVFVQEEYKDNASILHSNAYKIGK